jgi:hypothetical protein
MAIYMGPGPSVMYAAEAWIRQEQGEASRRRLSAELGRVRRRQTHDLCG